MTTQNIAFYDKGQVDGLLAEKANTDDLATVATTGSYDDLTNKPTIPAAQVNSDWNASSGVAEILNKPDLSIYLPKQTREGGYWAYGLIGATQSMIMAAYEDYGDTFCLRGSSSHTFQVGTPTDPKHPATKDYVDTALTGKLSVVGAGAGTRVYSVDGAGNQLMIDVVQGVASANAIARRTASGTIRTATPTDNADAATKQYVDNAITGITGTITVTDNTDYITITY